MELVAAVIEKILNAVIKRTELQSLHVSGQSRQTHKKLVVHFKNLMHIVRYRLLMNTVAHIARDCNASFAGHGNHARPVVLHNRLHRHKPSQWLEIMCK